MIFVVSLISRFMANSTELYFATAKRIIRYLKGTLEFGIWYQHEGKSELLGYTDSNYAGDVDDSRSTSGYVFLMSGRAVTWSSRKQPIVTLSTTEAMKQSTLSTHPTIFRTNMKVPFMVELMVELSLSPSLYIRFSILSTFMTRQPFEAQ